MSLSIGERLKSAREAKQVSLEEACRVTKIQRSTLEAIEKDQVQNILDPVYAKIFLRKYTTYLGLDSSALVDEYQAVYNLLPQIPVTSPQNQMPSGSAASPLGWRAVLAVFGMVALIGVGFVGYLTMDFYKALKKRHSTAHSVPAKRSNQQATVEKIPTAPKLIVPRSQPLKLTVRTKADVWMQVKSDGSVIFQDVLRKGSQENWTAKDELKLWTGNAGVMEMVLNGKPLGSPGIGVKKGIRVTREGLKL